MSFRRAWPSRCCPIEAIRFSSEPRLSPRLPTEASSPNPRRSLADAALRHPQLFVIPRSPINRPRASRWPSCARRNRRDRRGGATRGSHRARADRGGSRTPWCSRLADLRGDVSRSHRRREDPCAEVHLHVAFVAGQIEMMSIARFASERLATRERAALPPPQRSHREA